MGKVTKKFIVIMMLVSLVFCNNSTVVLATEISDFIEENTIAEETETIDSVDEAITAPEEASDNDEVVTEENNDAATAEEVIEDSENISEPEKVDEKDDESEVVNETATEAVEDDEKSEEPAEDVEPEEKAEEDEEKVNMPELNLSEKAGDIEVTVHADEDIFPEGTTMNLRLISQSEIYDVVNKAVEGNVAEIQAVDITFMHEGKEIEPAGPVSVNLKTTKTETSNNQVVHIDDNKNVDVLNDAQINQEAAKVTAAFDAEEFSVYAIVSIDDDGNETTEVFFRTYNFKDINGEGTYVDYEFQTVSGNTLTSQKMKNGDNNG